MTPEEKFALISRNTQEIVTVEELKNLLKEKKHPVIYLGTAITGKPHIAYFVWVIKLADFLKAGLKVKLLLADLHGALEGTPFEVLDKRYEYYKEVVLLMLKSINVDPKNLEFIKGSDYQLDKKYFYDLLKLSSITNAHDAQRAGSEVVKHSDNPKLSGLIYPLMQAIDEEYLQVDIQYGGIDQRKILMFAREFMPKIGYRSRIELMTPLVPGLMGKKMSASDPKSKIDLLDDEKTVIKKIQGAHCEAGIIEDNGILAFLKQVIMVLKEDAGEEFIIKRPEKFGGNLSFKTYSEIEKAFKEGLHPLDLKNGLAKEVNKLLKVFKEKDLSKLSFESYPEN